MASSTRSPHKKKYLGEFYPGYGDQDKIFCEVCGRYASDIHHIEERKMGGSDLLDTPDNLMALCRSCHTGYHDYGKYTKEFLKQVHDGFMRYHESKKGKI